MSQVRRPAVAGMFYPSDKVSLEKDIQRYIDEADCERDIVPKAIIVPHAGYVYSGPIAATAYKQIIPLKAKINRVVLIGPSHRVAFNGLAIPKSDIFNTPLGNISIDQNARELISELPQVIISEQAHQEEHSLEVQLPFLQKTLGDFSLIPIVVGNANRYDVAEVINKLWGDEHTLIVISTDLSHYHEYGEAKIIDQITSNAIENLQSELIDYDSACGRNGLIGLMTVVEEKDLAIDLLDLRNSGDTAGDKNRVVGYASYVIH